MTHRTARVGELIRRELATVLERGHGFGDRLVTIHAVDVAPDMHNATVYVGIIGGRESTHEEVIEKLRTSRGAIQRDLYKRVKLRNSPLLSFRLDRSAIRGVRVLNAIENLPPEAPQYEPPPEGFYGEPKTRKKDFGGDTDPTDLTDLDEDEDLEDSEDEEEGDDGSAPAEPETRR